ncbi:hypothetical protein [Fodinicurvata sp. EGI_FJ10296]|uniref:hypothetical protein n=1 Tax=Fodinicurvata sp. EGI_FJ10296 TaxID=3231908 RepID=UPI003454D3F8
MADDGKDPVEQPDGRSANARRVARHKARLAESGLKQVNIQAPVAAHPILKDLGRRLKAGQPIEEALFELAARHARAPQSPEAAGAVSSRPPDTERGNGLTGRLGRLFRGRSQRGEGSDLSDDPGRDPDPGRSEN